MDKVYADTVRLLLNIAPDVFDNVVFAMKGGTAINLFVRDMPRLSVDIDVVYTPLDVDRETALAQISSQLGAIQKRLERAGMTVIVVPRKGLGDSTIRVQRDEIEVKVEVNGVFRGTVLPVQRRPLVAPAAAKFSAELTVPVLETDELYGSKLVAAMDRQHPRDLFDVMKMYAHGGLSPGIVECFVTYIAGHNRPTPHVLFANKKDISTEYQGDFVGMTTEPVSLDELLQIRDKLFAELPALLDERQRRFLVGLTRAKPDWSLLQCKHADKLPALQWKAINLAKFEKDNPEEFERQARELESKLSA